MNRYAKVRTSQLLGLAAARVEDGSPNGAELAAELRARADSLQEPPRGARIASPACANCGHVDLHWIAAGQDICTALGGCNCESFQLGAVHS